MQLDKKLGCVSAFNVVLPSAPPACTLLLLTFPKCFWRSRLSVCTIVMNTNCVSFINLVPLRAFLGSSFLNTCSSVCVYR